MTFSPVWLRSEPALGIELLEIAVDSPLAERDATVRRKVSGNPRPLRHPVVQRDQRRHLLLVSLHALGKRVTQPFDDLEQRQVDIGKLAAEYIRPTAFRQDALDPAAELRHAITPEVLRPPLRGRL